MSPILQVFYSLISGLLLAGGIPNEIFLFGCPILTLVAFIPLYLAFSTVSSYRRAFILGFIQTITTHLASSFWLAYFKDFAIITLGASAFGTGVIGGVFGLFLYLPFSSSYNKNKLNIHSLHEQFINSRTFKILYFSALYTLYEWVKSSGFLGYPWGTVSATMFTWPVIMQLSAITGTYGITFIILILNCFIGEGLMLLGNFALLPSKYLKDFREYQKHRIFSLKTIGKTFSCFIILILIYGIFEYYKPLKPIKTLNTVLVQQNFDPWSSDTDRESILLSQELTKKQLDLLKENNEKPELVVWSEGCLKRPFPFGESYYQYFPETSPLVNFIRISEAPFIFGGSYVDGEKFYNSALMFDKYGTFRGYYGKNHLVPFAESLPFIEYPKIRAIMEKIIGINAGWFPGEQYVYFEVPCTPTENYELPAIKNIDLTQSSYEQTQEESKPVTVKFTTPICFDDAFTDVMRPMFLNGAELFVNITDDSWSCTKSSEIQHFAIAAYRAIEYRTTLIRSANAGYSVVVTPNGKIINDQPLFEASSTTCNVPIYERKVTTYARFGNWLPYVIGFLAGIYFIYMFITFKKSDFIQSERNKPIKLKKKQIRKNKKNKKRK